MSQNRVPPGASSGLGANDVSPADRARFIGSWTKLPVRPWRWPSPDQALWTRDGLLAWTMGNNLPGSPVGADMWYSIFVGARSNQDLAHIEDGAIAWDWDSRGEQPMPSAG